MQNPSKVLLVIAALGLCASATPAAAADRIAIVTCSVIGQDGPTAISLQIAGEARQQQSGFRFVFRSGDSNSSSIDVTGRSCAAVLADLANDGFVFRSSNVSGRQLILLWESS